MPDKKTLFEYFDRLTDLDMSVDGAKEYLMGELIVESEDEFNDIKKEWEELKDDNRWIKKRINWVGVW